MIATVRIRLEIPDKKAKEALAREEPGAVARWETRDREDRQQIETILEDWIKDDIPRMLEEHAVGDEVEVDW